MSKLEKFRARLRGATVLSLVAALSLGSVSSTLAKDLGFKVLYTFRGGNDGGQPDGGLIADKAGDLYGTTYAGGANNFGTVFKLAPDGTETVLHSFTGGQDGAYPLAGLVMDKTGALYGTTSGADGESGYGTVFKVAPDGTETVLYAFTGGADGSTPHSGLIEHGGKLDGTTFWGGASGWGTVYEITKSGKEKVLYSFTGVNDGVHPQAVPIMDKAGNLYGTASEGGADGYGVGTVYKLAPDGTETTLYTFTGNGDGGVVYGGLVMDQAGNLYGTTNLFGLYGHGTVFEVAPDGTETTLHTFLAGSDGASPVCTLLKDAVGNLYGTTTGGGADNEGTVFKLAPDGTETVLYSFTGGSDGRYPLYGSLIWDKADEKGDLYGTVSSGGDNGNGTVFRLRK